ncbi:hypothetical protein [Companilactobacillus zhongbaensis]|nr:hypothetical protein [Companilactobacillus zhongbaensis]
MLLGLGIKIALSNFLLVKLAVVLDSAFYFYRQGCQNELQATVAFG